MYGRRQKVRDHQLPGPEVMKKHKKEHRHKEAAGQMNVRKELERLF